MPQKLQKKLSPYQRRGSNWLLSLYEARMGGILADEMGLGKTLQVIAALSAAKKKDGSQKSIVVTPTSLTYHWLAEMKRFDDGLIVRVVTGQRDERRHTIADLKKDDSVDVILTSYPLLRRDVEYYKDIPLRFAVLDEAQSVKNAQSQGALAAKELDAQVRVALASTPWRTTLANCGASSTSSCPAIWAPRPHSCAATAAANGRRSCGSGSGLLMRRLKSEVLSLPEKHEQYLYAAMPPEQERVYQTLLATLRQHVGQALDEGSLPRARMQVLSVLLEAAAASAATPSCSCPTTRAPAANWSCWCRPSIPPLIPGGGC